MFKLRPKTEGPTSDKCFGYEYANDPWKPESVQRLREGLAAQEGIKRDKATAVVIGAGTLPYTLGYLGVSRVTLLDRKQSVLDSVRGRVEALQEPEIADWDDWYDHVSAGMGWLSRRFSVDIEYRRAMDSGLRGDFATTRRAAKEIEIRQKQEDLLTGFPALAEELRDEDREVSFVNVTNVAAYLRYDGKNSYSNGRRVLTESMADLPFAPGALIVDRWRLAVRVHLATDYMSQTS